MATISDTGFPRAQGLSETMNTYGHLFPDSEDLGRAAVDAALASALAEQERNRSAR